MMRKLKFVSRETHYEAATVIKIIGMLVVPEDHDYEYVMFNLVNKIFQKKTLRDTKLVYPQSGSAAKTLTRIFSLLTIWVSSNHMLNHPKPSC